MAPSVKKRKIETTNDSFLRANRIVKADSRPSKRSRPDLQGQPSDTFHISKISNIQDEEKAFPRGGASVLSPLEYKQIQIEATRDVLFENQGLQSLNPSEDKSSSTLRYRNKKSKDLMQSKPDENVVKIEGLSYKRVVPGSFVLGQIYQINTYDIALSLPNNLTGYIPITSISERVTDQLQSVAAAEENENEDGKIEMIDLNFFFSIGQYLRALVVATEDRSGTGTPATAKRHIELTINPNQSNNSLSLQNIIPHMTLMASVVSVEDHGIIMDIGLARSELRGFISSNEIGQDMKLSSIREGAVILCMVTGLSSNGKIVKLSADTERIGNLKKSNFLTEALAVDALLPGTAVEALITEVSHKGILGKFMGMVDVTADLIHSGAGTSLKDIEKTYKLGSKIHVRIICTFPAADHLKFGVSSLDHVLSLSRQRIKQDGLLNDPLAIIPLSTIIEKVTVGKVEPGIGVFADLGVKGAHGFVHISRLKDGKIETISASSGAYKVGTTHRGRVIGYNLLDGLFLLSLELHTLEQPFLRIEDLKTSDVVKGKVEKLVINASGVGGILINLADGITGFVPPTHMADVRLLHPEKRYREGTLVTARVISMDPSKRQVRLTLKKSLVNSEAFPFTEYANITVGMQSPGTIIHMSPAGAVVQFYGDIRGFLPVAEMSEAFIQDPSQIFQIGQVVNVHVVRIDPQTDKMIVSCKDPVSSRLTEKFDSDLLKLGSVISGKVISKSDRDISIEVDDLGVKAILPIGHLTDGSESKNASTSKRIRIGQILVDLVILEVLQAKHLIIVTNKPSLVKDAKLGQLITKFESIVENQVIHGFVKSINSIGVFVQFGGGVTGLLPKSKLKKEALSATDFGLRKFQTLEVRVISVDYDRERFVLCTPDADQSAHSAAATIVGYIDGQRAINAVDGSLSYLGDLVPGRLTKGRVISIKETQINVQLADNIQGRIDISQIFDSWDIIKDRKHPLRGFSAKQIIDVRVLGIHDARNHRFLPISHRTGKTLVFELTAKPSDLNAPLMDPLSLDKVTIGSEWIAFVNNVGDDCLWVNLSPNVRGRLRILDISDDVSVLRDLESNFPIGSALRVQAISIDLPTNRLDLSTRTTKSLGSVTFNSLSSDMVLPARITKTNERQIMVQLSDEISAPVNLIDLMDDFAAANTSVYNKNDILRVCIVEIDRPGKRLRLSTRPSRVLNSSLPIKDPEILSISHLQINSLIRGFVSNISDKGVFVHLGGALTAFVRVSDLSDSYIKDWKSDFQINQLVKGKVIALDPVLKHIQLSLKASVIDKHYVTPVSYNDISIGQTLTGKIRKVEDFGVFVVVDNSANVSGLCHRSEMAETLVSDVRKLYNEGDKVKAIVLNVDPDNKRISFGLKVSYFENDPSSEEDAATSPQNTESSGSEDSDGDNGSDSDGGVDLRELENFNISTTEIIEDSSTDEMVDIKDVMALEAGGFDWTAQTLDHVGNTLGEPEEKLQGNKSLKKRSRSEIKIDRTGDLDTNGPQSITDYERLVLGQPNSSKLWIEYMSFMMQLSELEKARAVAERAIDTINVREETEKLNIWVARLNLENEFGTTETVDDIFKRACQYNDAQEIFERMASIYIQSRKYDKANSTFQALVKKFSQSPSVWYNYAHFLYNSLSSPEQGRALLSRATQSLPPHAHLNLAVKFAALEFHSSHGSPERGRTIFEGLLSTFPKRLDIWNQLLDLEIQQGDANIIRGLFEHVLGVQGLKPKGAKALFRRWSDWEGKNGDKHNQAIVRAKAEEWVKGAVGRNTGP